MPFNPMHGAAHATEHDRPNRQASYKWHESEKNRVSKKGNTPTLDLQPIESGPVLPLHCTAFLRGVRVRVCIAQQRQSHTLHGTTH